MKKRILSIFLIMAMLISTIGCSKSVIRKEEEPDNEIVDATTPGNKNDETNIPEIEDDGKSIEFSDFLVERCVRKQLGKDWDEDITVEDVEGITSLTISSIYDPTFSANDFINHYRKYDGVSYLGYIDLIDLKYFKNLKELKLDTYGVQDSIVNIDVIKECNKLERLSIPWSGSVSQICSINTLGYKCWQEIISELPELKYLNLGRYFDKYMIDVMLSETDNKDIEIYTGDKEEWEPARHNFFVGLAHAFDMVTIDDYTEVWDYEYKTVEEKASGVSFPAIYTDLHKYWSDEYSAADDPYEGMDNRETLMGKLGELSDDTEDIIIVYDGTGKFDFSVFERFNNLVTLTVVGSTFGKTSDGTSGGITAINLESLSNCKDLQVLNLSGFTGDLSDITKIAKLREASITNCDLSTVDFIGELDNLNELYIKLSPKNSTTEYHEKVNEEITSLKKLKACYDLNRNYPEGVQIYKNISNMESLETLIIWDCKSLNNVTKSKTIKNMSVYGFDEISELSFDEMVGLENIVLCTGSSVINNELMTITELPNIRSVTYSHSVAKEIGDILTMELAEKIINNKNITSFAPYNMREYMSDFYDQTTKSFIKTLYDAGIYDGIAQQLIENGWAYGDEYTFDDVIKTYGK